MVRDRVEMGEELDMGIPPSWVRNKTENTSPLNELEEIINSVTRVIYDKAIVTEKENRKEQKHKGIQQVLLCDHEDSFAF